MLVRLSFDIYITRDSTTLRTLSMIVIDLKLRSKTLSVFSRTLICLFMWHFLNFKFMGNVGIDATVGAMQERFFGIEDKLVIFPTINPENLNTMATVVDYIQCTRSISICSTYRQQCCQQEYNGCNSHCRCRFLWALQQHCCF